MPRTTVVAKRAGKAPARAVPEPVVHAKPVHQPRPKVKIPKIPTSERQCCRRCGKFDAQIIGRSEWFPVVYLRCDGCHLTSVTPA